MTQIDDLAARRAELELNIALLERKLKANALDQAEQRKLDTATAALAQVDETLASTREALARREAKVKYLALLAEQKASMKRQREIAVEVARLKDQIASAWNKAKPLIREHQSITAGSRSTIERLWKLADEAGNGLDPMGDIDTNEGAPLDEGFVRLIVGR